MHNYRIEVTTSNIEHKPGSYDVRASYPAAALNKMLRYCNLAAFNTDKQLNPNEVLVIKIAERPIEHKCTQPLNRKCWDCGFCIDRKGCVEPVLDGYGSPIQ